MYSSLYLCLMSILFCVSANVIPIDDLYRLDIVHYNDFHARFEETTVSYPICKTNDTKCLGGFARLYQGIQMLLKQKPGALLLNAGDTYQGTYWYTLLKWNVTQRFINMLPNDAHALGNHEFDDGVPGLVPYLRSLKAPVVAANLVVDKDSPLNGLYQSHIIVEKGGRKIGIIGLITKKTELVSNAKGVTFLESIPVAQREAQALTEKGVDIIIVLSHCGLEVDMKMAKEVGDDIDIIVGGHSHSLLWNGEPPSHETKSGTYPIIIKSETKPDHRVLIVTASAFSKYLGNVTVYFDKTGELQSFEGEPVFLNRSIPEDPEIKALLQPYTTQLDNVIQEVIGYAKEELDMELCSHEECALGNFVADAYLNTSAELYPTPLPRVALIQRCMIRSSIPRGDITRGVVLNMAPFENKLVTFVLLGRYLLDALEKCVTNPWVVRPYNGPYTPQVAGLRVTFNTTTGRAISVHVKEGDIYKPLELDKEYQVSTLDFLTRGGNGVTEFRDYGRNHTRLGTDADMLERYIRRLSSVDPQLDNRLTLLS